MESAVAVLFRIKYQIILALIFFFLAGCVSSTLVQTMLTDIERLKRDNVSLRDDIDALSDEVESLKQADDDGLAGSESVVTADDFPAFLADMSIEEGASEAVATPLSRPSRLSGEEVYAKAQSLYAQSKFREAYQAFSQAALLDTDSEFQARCNYWMGECMYSQAAYQGALDHFGRVFIHHGASSKAPDALLKIGFTYYEMKNYNGARQALDEFLRRFPNHRSAPLAEERLNRMRYNEQGGAGDLDN
jgi:TolA-binding protein